MKNKMTLKEFQQYVISEATKLYKLEQLKEQKDKTSLSEIDKKAMAAAKKDIEDEFLKFTPLGKNKFEKHLDKKELKKAMSPENTHKLEEKKYSDAASEFIGKEIGHLQKDKDYNHDRAVAAAINVAKDKGYKVPKKTNESSDVQEFKFIISHDKGKKRIKTTASSLEAAKKKIMSAEGCPESAIQHVG